MFSVIMKAYKSRIVYLRIVKVMEQEQDLAQQIGNKRVFKGEKSRAKKTFKGLILSEEIKEAIRTNVAELKELLKDDQETLIKVIERVVNDIASSQDIDYLVRCHYSEVIEQCEKEKEAWPEEVKNARNAAADLYFMSRARSNLTAKQVKEMNPPDEEEYSVIKQIGKLCQEEIGREFNPDVDYRYDLSTEEIWMKILEAQPEIAPAPGSDEEW